MNVKWVEADSHEHQLRELQNHTVKGKEGRGNIGDGDEHCMKVFSQKERRTEQECVL